MNSKIEDVKKDIAELEKLLSEATRPKVKDILSIEIRRLVSEVVKLEDENRQQENSAAATPTEINRLGGSRCYQVKLNNYAWDQTQKFLKLYVTIPKVHTLSTENITCNWTNKSVELFVKGLENKDYLFNIKNLLAAIDPEKSSWKIKTDTVLIMAAKVVEEKWSHVTELEKKASDSKKLMPEKPDESSDPSESLMNMMKKMYESGDDEMKRVIAKAWTEGQQNKQMNI